jgi:glycosyltransferase involved in cell wall biosynthesis
MKKVLIVTYYWPPGGGPGVQRVLKFVKYLPHFGWQPVILTVQDGNYPELDFSLKKDIPAVCPVYTSKSIEPFSLYKKFTGRKSEENIPDYVFDSKNNFKDRISRWIRVNFFIPDSRMGWIPFAVKKGLTIIEKENIDLIFTSSPPHTVQIIANRLVRKANKKWVADFRDPWVDTLSYENTRRSALAVLVDSRLEKSVLRHADAVVCVTQQYVERFKQRMDNRYFKIFNGYDEDDFVHVAKAASNKFRIIYTGSLSETRNIDNVLLALKNLNEEVKKNIELSFYGFVNQKVQKRIGELQLSALVKLNSHVSHQYAIEQMVNADMLLLVVHETAANKGIIPGKLFEYLATGNFILALGHKEGEVAQILRQTACGEIFDYQEDLTEIINRRYEAWIKKEPFKANMEEIKKYSRKNQTSELVHIFEQVLRQ